MTTLEIICLYGLGISLCLLLFDAAGKTLRAAWRRNGRRYGVAASLIGLAVVCTINAQKPGPTPVITVDSFLADAGSYATNDVLHVAVTNAPAYAGIDFSSCPVLVYARPRGLSDAPEWEELLPRRTFSELPADYAIEDATNYNYLVYLDYVPPSPVHTNGVFELRGFVVPGDEPGNLEQLAAGFATSTIVDNREIVPIEYLESTGTQWIDTGIYASEKVEARVDFQELARRTGTGIFGTFGINQNRTFYLYQGGNSVWQFGCGPYSNTGKSTDTNRHHAVVSNGKLMLDGVLLGSVNVQPFTTERTLLLFNMWRADGTKYADNPRRIYSFSLVDVDTQRTIIDFIPVRVGRIGYMFDRVSGEYLPFGNAGASAFILGPDTKE